jgi:hypothetical protein
VSRALVVTLALALLGLAGCGGEGSSAGSSHDADGVRVTMRAFIHDLMDFKFDDACALLTHAQQAETGSGDASLCAKKLAFGRGLLSEETLAGYADRLEDLEITVDGDAASSPELSGTATAHFSYTDGHWLIDTAGG